jgi:glutamine phosphoribosylpyrophosphate amidotransferase
VSFSKSHVHNPDLFLYYLGETVIITKTKISVRQLIEPKNYTPCIFEYVYLARPDSVIDGISVYRSRLEMGEHLADQILKECGNHMDIDVVIPVSFQEGSDCFIGETYLKLKL